MQGGGVSRGERGGEVRVKRKGGGGVNLESHISCKEECRLSDGCDAPICVLALIECVRVHVEVRACASSSPHEF